MIVTNQGKTVLFMQVVQLIAVIILILMSAETVSTKAYSVVLALVFMGFGAWVTFYSINCMVLGSCNVFTWVVVGIMVVFFVFAVLATIFTYTAYKGVTNQLQALSGQATSFGSNFTQPIVSSAVSSSYTPISTWPTASTPPVAKQATPVVAQQATPVVAQQATPVVAQQTTATSPVVAH